NLHTSQARLYPIMGIAVAQGSVIDHGPSPLSVQRCVKRRRACAPSDFNAELGSSALLLNDLVCSRKHRGRNPQPQRLRGLDIDYEVEPGRPFDGQVGRLAASKDTVDNTSGQSVVVQMVRTIGHESTGLRVGRKQADRRQTATECQVSDAGETAIDGW